MIDVFKTKRATATPGCELLRTASAIVSLGLCASLPCNVFSDAYDSQIFAILVRDDHLFSVTR